MRLSWKGKPFTMTAKLALETASYERWEVHGRTQVFYFENNRPALVHSKAHYQKIHWLLLRGIEHLQGDPDNGALLIKEMRDQIEKLSMGKRVYATFQDVRNKR